MDRKVAKDLLHIQTWLQRVDEDSSLQPLFQAGRKAIAAQV